MADYYTPTVIQQTIPDAEMTPLEFLLLSHIFDAERDGDGWYFFSDQGAADMIVIDRAELERALAASQSRGDNSASVFVTEHMPRSPSGEPQPDQIDLDLSTMSWEFIVQDIVRRSPSLRYVTAVSSFTCSRMRPDGFGGLAVMITADAVVGKSTNELLEDFLAEAGLDREEGPATA